MEKLTKEVFLKAKEELIEKNLFSMQKELVKQRQIRIFVMSVLIIALVVTVIYGTLEDPISYTLSNIGNFFDYRLFFIIWAILTGIAIQSSIVALFKLEKYENRTKYIYLALSVVFLILTAVIPAIKSVYPFWHLVHTITAGLHAFFLLLSIVPFTNTVAKENPRLRQTLYIWETIIWGGGVLALLIIGHSAIFELWFFISMILFLLYLSLVLFEEHIVKASVIFLKDEKNLNDAIETLFINYEKKEKKYRKEEEKDEEHSI